MASWQRLRAFLVLTLALSMLFGASEAFAISQGDVDRARRQLDEAKGDLGFVEDDLDAAVARYQDVRARLADLEYRRAQLADRAQQYEAEVRGLHDKVRERAINAYISGGIDSVEVDLFFAAESYNEVVTSRQVMEQATAKDMLAQDRLTVAKREMERLRIDLAAEEELADELGSQMSDLVALLDVMWADAKEEVDEAGTELRETERELQAELERQRAEAERRRLAELAKKRGASAGTTAASTPGFICPVAGPNRFRNDWGNARSGGRTHKGTDMFSGRGNPVVAVGSGTVRLRSGGLGGTAIWLRADHGTSYYFAHLDRFVSGLRTGQRVSKGQVIGYVGNSGNARGGAHHLHFQLHPGHGAPVNPYPTLVKSC